MRNIEKMINAVRTYVEANWIYIKWFLVTLLDLLLVLVWYIGAPIVSIFTRPEVDTDRHTWGGWWGTYDNPPQGDTKWLREGWFPNITTGFKGYLNRIGWIWRNPGYNFQKAMGIPYSDGVVILWNGRENISDKYRKPGSYMARATDSNGNIIAWEFYIVFPYDKIGLPNKCFRLRIGYKIMTDKYERLGFAPLVNTIHILKSYGKDKK